MTYLPPWNTSDEIRFLTGIGEHSKKRRALVTSRKIELLNKYLSSMDVRYDWGSMDKPAIRRYAERLITSYEALSTKGT